MKRCEEYELEIEMRLHGALEASASPELDAHLASCPSCRAFETLSKKTEATMVAQALSDSNQVDWQDLKDRVGRKLSSDLVRRLSFAAVFLALGALVIILQYGVRPERLESYGLVGVSALAAVALIGAIGRLRMRRYEQARGDLLFYYRAFLERRLMQVRLNVLLTVPVIVLIYWVGAREPRGWVAATIFSALAVAITVYQQLVRRPALQRELDVIKKQ